MRLKSFPLGFPARDDGLGTTRGAPPLGDEINVVVVPPGEASNADPGAAVELVDDSPGGANMRLKSLPFPLGGAIAEKIKFVFITL